MSETGFNAGKAHCHIEGCTNYIYTKVYCYPHYLAVSHTNVRMMDVKK